MDNAHSTPSDDLVQAAKQLVAAKHALALRMPAGYVSDAAVVILFSLFASNGAGLSEKKLCAESTVAPSVTLRWLKVLLSDGLIEKTSTDQNPSFQLTKQGRSTAIATLATIGASWVDIRKDDGKFNNDTRHLTL